MKPGGAQFTCFLTVLRGLVYSGLSQDVKRVKAAQWTMAWDALAPCNLSDWHSAASSRCAFPDTILGAWNQTQVYACPTILTLARFNRVSLMPLATVLLEYIWVLICVHGLIVRSK